MIKSQLSSVDNWKETIDLLYKVKSVGHPSRIDKLMFHEKMRKFPKFSIYE